MKVPPAKPLDARTITGVDLRRDIVEIGPFLLRDGTYVNDTGECTLLAVPPVNAQSAWNPFIEKYVLIPLTIVQLERCTLALMNTGDE